MPDDASTFDPISFLEAAVQTPSHDDVGAMRDLLVETLADAGVDAVVDDAGNTLATRGTGDALDPTVAETDGTHLVFNTHIDTVTPHVPFERDGDVIRGRGACDAKGPLAAILDAFLTTDPGDGRVSLVVSPDEETLSTGAAALDLAALDADAVVVGEPTGLDVCNAAKGRFQGTVTLTGAAAHAAEPDSGVNAIAAMRELLDAVATFDDRADAPPAHPALGTSTLTPTTVTGGSATNQVPGECAVVLDRRSVPPETAEGFAAALTDHLRQRIPDDVGVDFALTDRESPFLEAWDTPPDHPLVETLAAAAGGDVRPFTAATEASYFAAHAPTVVFGPGVLADDDGAVAHAEREYVRVPEVRRAGDALRETVASLLA